MIDALEGQSAARQLASIVGWHADIGANLLDSMYSGEYNGKQYHEADLRAVLERAWAAGVAKVIITAGTLAESRAALHLSRSDGRLFCTAGVHPTRCNEFEAHVGGGARYMEELRAVAPPVAMCCCACVRHAVEPGVAGEACVDAAL